MKLIGLLFLTVPLWAQMTMHEHMHHDDPPQPGTPAAAVPDLLKDAFASASKTLKDFEQLALRTNPTLQEANALVQRSAGQARQSGLWPNPSAGYQGEHIRGGSYGGGEQGAFVQQNIVLGGKLGLRRNVYEQERKANEIGTVEQRYRVLSDVGQSFYSALAVQATVELRRNLMQVALDSVATAHQLANVGQADTPDVLQAEVEAEQAKLDFNTAQRNYIQQFRALAALVGEPQMPLSKLEGDLMHPPDLQEKEAINRIAEQSPTVKRAQQDVVRREAELRSAKRENIPDLQLRGGLEQSFEFLNEAGHPVGVQGFASAGVTLPIFNRNQGNVAAAQAELERSKAEVVRVRLSLQQSAQPLLQNYLASQTQAARYRDEMIPRAQRAYQLYLEKYRQMAAAYPQVLVSQRTLFQLQVSYLEVLRNLWTDAISLQNYLLSGGLEPVPAGSDAMGVNLPNASAGSSQ
jgi:outer membrane protein, heavy metal efflux system